MVVAPTGALALNGLAAKKGRTVIHCVLPAKQQAAAFRRTEFRGGWDSGWYRDQALIVLFFRSLPLWVLQATAAHSNRTALNLNARHYLGWGTFLLLSTSCRRVIPGKVEIHSASSPQDSLFFPPGRWVSLELKECVPSTLGSEIWRLKVPLLLLLLLLLLSGFCSIGRSGLFIIIVKRITINNERMGPSVSNWKDLNHLRDFCLFFLGLKSWSSWEQQTTLI